MFSQFAQLTGKDTDMPAKLIFVLGFTLVSFGAAAQVSANWFSAIFNHVARETKRRQCWPEPFTAPDRAAVRTPFCTMVNNGWRKQNLLGEFHFKPGTAELTEAGKNKVRWILTECPEQHRMVYIHTALTKEETLARCATVEKLVAQIAPDFQPPIMTTSIPDDGWSAELADKVGREYLKSIPTPRLPKDTNPADSGESSF